MKKKNLIYGIILLIVVVVILYLAVDWMLSPGEFDEFAQCLTSKGVIMYGTDWCPHCKEQKALFGKSFQFIDYRNCNLKREECTAMGVQGYPTWLINGEKYAGERSPEILSKLSGCSLT